MKGELINSLFFVSIYFMNKNFLKAIIKSSLIFLLFLLLPFSYVLAQEDIEKSEVFKGKILESKEVACNGISEEEEYQCIMYTVRILDEKYGDVETMPTWINNREDIFKVGSKVYVSSMEDLDGQMVWSVESYSRENSLLLLFLLFVVLIIVIAGKRGFWATVGLIMSFFILYFFAIPKLNQGQSIFLVGSTTLLLLLFASTFLTYGFNIKSVISFVSTFMGILIIAGLGALLISKLNISGSGEEASAMLFDTTNGGIKLSTVFLLSIVIGALGVLDDVTVGQTSSMIEIYGADRKLTRMELFKKGMNIGKDHISSMVNTLFIAYAGSSFSLVMLLSANSPDLRILLNTGFVIEEIVRTLVASIGLILVVPLASFISSIVIVKVLK